MGGGHPPAGASTGGGQAVRSVATGCALGDSDMLKGLGQVGRQAACTTEELQLHALDAALPHRSSFFVRCRRQTGCVGPGHCWPLT